jgi:predicted nucleic acid-binding protein
MIVDASVAFKWIVAEPDSPIAIAWIGQGALRAPHLIHSEVGNALTKRIRSGQFASSEGAGERLGRLSQLLATVDETPLIERALEMAVTLDHSFYDCVYAALAEANSEELLTSDKVFAAKIERAGLGIKVLTLDHMPEQA